jgi:eukaryotic-like serine/threonine-protein kinase
MSDIKVEPVSDVPASTQSARGPSVWLKGEIEIFPSDRLAHLDQGPIKAYAARTKAGVDAFALLCEKHLQPQINLAQKYLAVGSLGLPRLLGAGVVTWTPAGLQRYVFVYENNIGQPVAGLHNFMAMGVKNDIIANVVVRKLAPILKEMRDHDFAHGHIRLTNLYTGNGKDFEKVMLGECLSAPQGTLSPSIYETIERSLTNPLGRGQASYDTDMFALGVTLALMMRQHDPLEGMSEQEILQARIEHGSYATIMGKERVVGSVLELLRGLLTDDTRSRWTIDEVMVWCEGRRVNPKQGGPQRTKASRPLDFLGEKYLRPQALAAVLTDNPLATQQLVDSGQLKLWLNRSVQDKATEERVNEAIQKATEVGVGGFHPDRLAAFLSMSLSPNMPLMYRGLKMMPDSFGRLLTEAVISKRDLNPYAEIIQNNMVLFWVNTVDNLAVDVGDLVTRFDTCRSFLRQSLTGYGIERCVYFLNPEAPCLSEKLAALYIRTPEELLDAFEVMSGQPNRPEQFFDRHIVAFLSVRDRSVIDPYIPDLSSDEKHRQVLGTLRVLALIQSRAKMKEMPGVCEWLAGLLDPLINRFHDRDVRQKIRAQVQKVKSKGDLQKLSALFDNINQNQEDFRMFRQAMRDYASYKQEYARLENDLNNNPEFGFDMGRHAAAITSAVIAGMVIILFMIYHFSQKGVSF